MIHDEASFSPFQCYKNTFVIIFSFTFSMSESTAGLTVKLTWHPDPQLHWHFGLLIHNHPAPEFLVLGTLKSDSQSYITSSLLLNLILSVLLYLSTSFMHPRLNDQLLLLFISMFLLWVGEQNILQWQCFIGLWEKQENVLIA